MICASASIYPESAFDNKMDPKESLAAWELVLSPSSLNCNPNSPKAFNWVEGIWWGEFELNIPSPGVSY